MFKCERDSINVDFKQYALQKETLKEIAMFMTVFAKQHSTHIRKIFC